MANQDVGISFISPSPLYFFQLFTLRREESHFKCSPGLNTHKQSCKIDNSTVTGSDRLQNWMQLLPFHSQLILWLILLV